MIDYDYDYDDYFDLDSIWDSREPSTDNSASGKRPFMKGQVTAMGKVFTTGNAVVAGLAKGTTLVVSGDGELTIVDGVSGASAGNGAAAAPAPVSFENGDEIVTKHGSAIVVGVTSQTDRLIAALRGETDDVVYLTDSDNVLRSAPRSSVSA